MKLKTTLIILLIIICTGCIKYKELNSLSIISSITISKDDKKYNVTMQEIIPTKKEDGVSYIYKYRQSSNENLEKAFKKITNHSPKTIYLNKVQNVIITENNKDEIIKEFIEYYKKQKSFNKNTSLVIAKNDLKKVLKVNSNYQYIDSILKDKKIKLIDIKDKKKIKVPAIKISNKELIFTKYYTITI